MINPYNNHNALNLTGVVEITADTISLILNENNETEIKDILNILLRYENIEPAAQTKVHIGGGQSYYEYTFPNASDTKVAGLQSMLTYLDENYRNNDDDSMLNNYYTSHKKRTYILITRQFYHALRNNIM